MDITDVMNQSPLRRPQWRMDRVLKLLHQTPVPERPRRADCHNVRVYYKFLREWAASRHNERRRAELLAELPEVYQAHQLHYSADVESRQIVEAYLLTSQPFAEIAQLLAVAPKAIEYYEALFFNVRDRLKATAWIRMAIRGERPLSAAGPDGGLSVDQRGYVLRLFAYHGGPLVLDAAINGFLPKTMPLRPQDAGPWCADVLQQLLQTIGVAALVTLTVKDRLVMQLLRLAVKTLPPNVGSSRHEPTEVDIRVNKMLRDWMPHICPDFDGKPKG